MDISVKQLREILLETFDRGYHSGYEFQNEMICSIADKYHIDKDSVVALVSKQEAEARLYTIAELSACAAGTKFEHAILGKCRIEDRQGKKCMVFERQDLEASAFNVQGYPWDQPMRLINDE